MKKGSQKCTCPCCNKQARYNIGYARVCEKHQKYYKNDFKDSKIEKIK